MLHSTDFHETAKCKRGIVGYFIVDIVIFTVQLNEIQYTKGLATGKKSGKVGAASSRGPYKRDERVLKDEDLLQKLREYGGRPEQF